MMEYLNSELKTSTPEWKISVDSSRDRHSKGDKHVSYSVGHIHVLSILPDRVDTTSARRSELSRILRKSFWEFVFPVVAPKQLVDVSGVRANTSPLTISRAHLWSEEEVGEWVSNTLCLPQYKEAFMKNKIFGSRLCFINASTLPQMNVHNFDDIKFITSKIRHELNVGEDKYVKSLDLSQEDTLLKYLKFISGTGKKYEKATILECWRAMGVIQPPKPTPCHWFTIEPSKQYPRTVVPSRKKIEKYCVPNSKYKHLELHSAI